MARRFVLYTGARDKVLIISASCLYITFMWIFFNVFSVFYCFFFSHVDLFFFNHSVYVDVCCVISYWDLEFPIEDQ